MVVGQIFYIFCQVFCSPAFLHTYVVNFPSNLIIGKNTSGFTGVFEPVFLSSSGRIAHELRT